MGRMAERFGRQGARSKPEYFKEGPRLDWPKPKASRQSKKDVRACRPLSVSVHPSFPYPCSHMSATGNNPSLRPHQQAFLGPRTQIVDL